MRLNRLIRWMRFKLKSWRDWEGVEEVKKSWESSRVKFEKGVKEIEEKKIELIIREREL